MGSISISHWVILGVVILMSASPIMGIMRGVKNNALAHAILSAFIPIYGLIYFFAAATPASVTRNTVTSDQASKPFWRRGLAGFLDFLTAFFVGALVIGKFTGETPSQGIGFTDVPVWLLTIVIAVYFILGWKLLGGTIWQRILRAR